MANRVPLIVDTSTLFLKELPVGDGLDLTGSNLVGVNNIDIAGITTISVSSASTALTVVQSGSGPGVHIVSAGGTALYVDGQSQLTRVAITTTATDLTLESGISYAFYSGTNTLTLPASPTAGDTLRIINRSGTITTLIERNGSNIMGVADDVTFDLTNETFNFTYANATDGWIISR
jgi:hypothetical protein